jgi:hypothetical protein
VLQCLRSNTYMCHICLECVACQKLYAAFRLSGPHREMEHLLTPGVSVSPTTQHCHIMDVQVETSSLRLRELIPILQPDGKPGLGIPMIHQTRPSLSTKHGPGRRILLTGCSASMASRSQRPQADSCSGSCLAANPAAQTGALAFSSLSLD